MAKQKHPPSGPDHHRLMGILFSSFFSSNPASRLLLYKYDRLLYSQFSKYGTERQRARTMSLGECPGYWARTVLGVFHEHHGLSL